VALSRAFHPGIDCGGGDTGCRAAFKAHDLSAANSRHQERLYVSVVGAAIAAGNWQLHRLDDGVAYYFRAAFPCAT